MGVGTGRAKLLLFGEHAAVYGYPAVGVTLASCITIELQRDARGSWELEGVEETDRAGVQRVLGLLEGLVGGRGRGGRAVLRSSIPRGLGFGSSAALCVAAASAVAPAGSDRRQVWAWAHEAERLFHGTPSGIDTGLSLLGGLYRFQPRPPALPEERRLRGLPLSLVVGAVPRLGNAGALIGALRERVAAGEAAATGRLERLGDIAVQAAELLDGPHEAAAGPPRALGRLADEAQGLLAELGLASPELEMVLADGRAAGALGGKLSGAGGGGAFFLVFPDAASARAAAEGLRRSAAQQGLPTAPTIQAQRLDPAALAAPSAASPSSG